MKQSYLSQWPVSPGILHYMFCEETCTSEVNPASCSDIDFPQQMHFLHGECVRCAVNPGRARWGQSLLISTPKPDPLLRLGRVSSQSPRGPLGGHACVHTANSNWQQYIIKLISSFQMMVILCRETHKLPPTHTSVC